MKDCARTSWYSGRGTCTRENRCPKENPVGGDHAGLGGLGGSGGGWAAWEGMGRGDALTARARAPEPGEEGAGLLTRGRSTPGARELPGPQRGAAGAGGGPGRGSPFCVLGWAKSPAVRRGQPQRAPGPQVATERRPRPGPEPRRAAPTPAHPPAGRGRPHPAAPRSQEDGPVITHSFHFI